MSIKPQANRYVVEQVLQKGWDFLNKNFENFSTTQKIQISLELCKKSMPTDLNINGEVSVKIHDILKAGESRIEQYTGTAS
jgi:hypothetical protein